ncbi:MAG: hypothetical protein AB7Q17_15995 [Phycisphaerae bacterium]
MSHHASIFQRISGLFRTDHNGGPRADGGDSGVFPAQGSTHTDALPRAESSLMRWARSGVTSSRDRVARVEQVLDALEQHFRQQDQRSEELSASVHRVAGILEQLGDAQRTQGEFVRAIASHVDVTNQQAAKISSTLAQMPTAFQSQADAMRSVARQLEKSQATDAALADSLGRFGGAVDGLNHSSRAQVDALRQMQSADREHMQAISGVLREQSRRLVVLITIAAVLGVCALAAVATTLALVYLK